MNYYEILGVPRTATQEDIKKAYKAGAKIHHPDTPTGDPVVFSTYVKAYEVLGNIEERRIYDEELDRGIKTEGQFTGKRDDLFSNVFSKNRESSSSIRGKNRTSNITISFEDSIAGTVKTVSIGLVKKCSVCKGTGKLKSETSSCTRCGGSKEIKTTVTNPMGGSVVNVTRCPDCKDFEPTETVCEPCSGKGKIKEPVKVKVVIPPGIKTGGQVRVKGYGEAGTGGGDTGDLIITVTVEESSSMTRDGSKLLMTKEVTFTQLLLGTRLEVETVEGVKTLNVPPKTKPGAQLVMKGLGTYGATDSRRGDLLVSLEMIMPDLTEEQIETLKSMNL